MRAKRIVWPLYAAALGVINPASADYTFTTLVQLSNGVGYEPYGLTVDANDNLFGATTGSRPSTFHSVYEVSGTNLTPLLVLSYTNGAFTRGPLTLDSAGNLYGMADNSGTNWGSVYELPGTTYSTVRTLAAFNYLNGSLPTGPLLIGTDGNFYGVTEYGPGTNYGTVFSLSGSNHQTLTQLTFFSGQNGGEPCGKLVEDSAGNLYGCTTVGGSNHLASVFELSGSNHQTLTTVASFNASAAPFPGGLVIDSAGNIYGISSTGPNGDNTVFELSGSNHQTLTTLVTFNGSNGGAAGNLLVDSSGNIFGTTITGGPGDDGTVFMLSGTALTTIAAFNSTPGYEPSGLAMDAAGNLFGTTAEGGANNDGTVFELAVPEPTNLGLMAAGMASLLVRRRKRLASD